MTARTDAQLRDRLALWVSALTDDIPRAMRDGAVAVLACRLMTMHPTRTSGTLRNGFGADEPICDSRLRGLIGQRGHDGFELDGGQSA